MMLERENRVRQTFGGRGLSLGASKYGEERRLGAYSPKRHRHKDSFKLRLLSLNASRHEHGTRLNLSHTRRRRSRTYDILFAK